MSGWVPLSLLGDAKPIIAAVGVRLLFLPMIIVGISSEPFAASMINARRLRAARSAAVSRSTNRSSSATRKS